MPPKILIGCPVSDYHAYATEDYLKAITSLTYKNYDILLVDNSTEDTFYHYLQQKNIPVMRKFTNLPIKEKIVKSRNVLRETVLTKEYDYFLSLEQDVIPPKDVIEVLLEQNKDIVSGVYYTFTTIQGQTHILPVIYRWPTAEEKKAMQEHQEDLKTINPELYQSLKTSNFDFSQVRTQYKAEDLEAPQLLKVKQTGLGCMLIARKVLEKVTFRYEEKEDAFDDYFFCEDARTHGFDVFCYTGIKCKHLLRERSWKWNDLTK